MGDSVTEHGELLYYDLKPRYRRTSGLATACMVQCIATGEYLSGSGGPSYALRPDIVHALDRARNGGERRMVVDQEAWDGLIAALGTIRDDTERGLRNIGFDEGSIRNYAAVAQADAALARAHRDD